MFGNMDKESVERKRTDGLSIELCRGSQSRRGITLGYYHYHRRTGETAGGGGAGRIEFIKRITIVHSNRMFSIPRFRGSDLTGLIKWGDGKSEEYADGSSHTYTTDPPYTVVVGMNGAEEVTLHDLSGVEEVDFSKF